ncbi:metallophosphoesterase family protein [Thermodesulfovibrio sp. 3907-1M]|uniref:Phosphoesterase n=1 Tax=Thermodesulfovibrio autotrophicus TaxID=3118333 RepID=A0AAU8GUY2_9BACT
MKIAILGDIHGNIEALKVAYRTALETGVDRIFHLGDLGGYAPFVNEVVDFLIEHNIPGVQGNYDEAVALDKPHCGCKYEDEFQAEMAHISLEWTKKHASDRAKEYMKNLPFSIDFLAEDKKVSIFHATPTKNNLYWYEERPDKFFFQMADKAKADVMIYGHTHIPYFKKINEKYFINAGSVGKPKDGDPRTCVCLVEIGQDHFRTEFIRKEYDIKKTVDAIIERGLPPYFAQKLMQAK